MKNPGDVASAIRAEDPRTEVGMEGCLFCKIASREVKATIVYEDERAVAFEDIHPQSPTHLLVIPRKHWETLNDVNADDAETIGHLFVIAARLARERGLEGKGYRTVINNGAWAGQTVDHLHVHVMGGRTFHWPPG